MDEATGASLNVLLVEDEPDFRDLLSFEFQARGCRPIAASGASQALELLERNPVDVIVSDILMPGASGYELLGRVKDRNLHWPPVILISAHPDEGLEEAHERGAEALLIKPFRLADLVAAAQRLAVPFSERWQTPSPDRAASTRRLGLQSARDSGAEPPLLGRGGARIVLEGPEPVPGDCVDFDLAASIPPNARLAGTAVVRWAQPYAFGASRHVCGVEFDYLEEDSRTAFQAWLTCSAPRQYIPSGRDLAPGPVGGEDRSPESC